MSSRGLTAVVPVARYRAHEVATDGFPTVGFPTIVEVSHPPTRAFEGASGRGRRRSQQRGRVFVAVSYTYLGGGMQPPGCRRVRVWFLIYVWCSGFLFVSSERCAHVPKLEVRPFFSPFSIHCGSKRSKAGFRPWCRIYAGTTKRTTFATQQL